VQVLSEGRARAHEVEAGRAGSVRPADPPTAPEGRTPSPVVGVHRRSKTAIRPPKVRLWPARTNLARLARPPAGQRSSGHRDHRVRSTRAESGAAAFPARPMQARAHERSDMHAAVVGTRPSDRSLHSRSAADLGSGEVGRSGRRSSRRGSGKKRSSRRTRRCAERRPLALTPKKSRPHWDGTCGSPGCRHLARS